MPTPDNRPATAVRNVEPRPVLVFLDGDDFDSVGSGAWHPGTLRAERIGGSEISYRVEYQNPDTGVEESAWTSEIRPGRHAAAPGVGWVYDTLAQADA